MLKLVNNIAHNFYIKNSCNSWTLTKSCTCFKVMSLPHRFLSPNLRHQNFYMYSFHQRLIVEICECVHHAHHHLTTPIMLPHSLMDITIHALFSCSYLIITHSQTLLACLCLAISCTGAISHAVVTAYCHWRFDT